MIKLGRTMTNLFIFLKHRNKLEKKYAPALDNYGQSCFGMSDFKKMKCVCKAQMMPPPDHQKEMKSNYLSLSNI